MWSFDTLKKYAKSKGDILTNCKENISLYDQNPFDKIKIEIFCKKCKDTSKILLRSYLRGVKGCLCSTHITWNYERVKTYISQYGMGDELVSSEFVNASSLIDIKCHICLKIYKQTFSRYRLGRRHTLCTHKVPVKPLTLIDKKCVICSSTITIPLTLKKKQTCSKSCTIQLHKRNHQKPEQQIKDRENGLRSIKMQNRRSKNEVYFFELCQRDYIIVVNNLQMFDGWDADIIIPDYKIAIHWNGPWHYKKLMENHDLEATQKRDELKYKAIENCGYDSYIIKDLKGRFNKRFVEQEYFTFLNFMEFRYIE